MIFLSVITNIKNKFRGRLNKVYQNINNCLARNNPQECLMDHQTYGGYIHCKTLKQVDINEYKMNVNKVSTYLEPGGLNKVDLLSH